MSSLPFFKKSTSSQSRRRDGGSARAFAFYQRCSFSTSLEHLSHKLRQSKVQSDTGNSVLLLQELVRWWDAGQSAQSSQANLEELLPLTQRPSLAWLGSAWFELLVSSVVP